MRGNRRTTIAVVSSLLLLTFFAGASAGVIGDRLIGSRKVVHIRAPIGDMTGVLDRLELTPEQRARAEGIVAMTAPRTRAIMLELGERLRLVADSVDVELRAILTAEQRLRLDSLKQPSRLMLKRKVPSTGRTTVDTLIDLP